MEISEAVRHVEAIRGWDWSRCNTRMGPLGWDYLDVLKSYMTERTIDVGTGGGEVFSAVARPGDVALDLDMDKLGYARQRLPCPLVCGDQFALPFREASFDVVADRHVGVAPDQVLRMLRPGGYYVTQQPGGHICQNIFEAFGWGSNFEWWARDFAEQGLPFWHPRAAMEIYRDAGCEIVRYEEAYVDYEFLDAESLAFWLINAPLPERVDPDKHHHILNSLPLKTNWHSELLVVRR